MSNNRYFNVLDMLFESEQGTTGLLMIVFPKIIRRWFPELTLTDSLRVVLKWVEKRYYEKKKEAWEQFEPSRIDSELTAETRNKQKFDAQISNSNISTFSRQPEQKVPNFEVLCTGVKE